VKSIFHSCCGDLPGSVAVRYSYDVFLNMIESDLQDWEYQKSLGTTRRPSGHVNNPVGSSQSQIINPVGREFSQVFPGKQNQVRSHWMKLLALY
jgi:hypothetical protein